MTYSIDDKLEDELHAEVLEKIELFSKRACCPTSYVSSTQNEAVCYKSS